MTFPPGFWIVFCLVCIVIIAASIDLLVSEYSARQERPTDKRAEHADETHREHR